MCLLVNNIWEFYCTSKCWMHLHLIIIIRISRTNLSTANKKRFTDGWLIQYYMEEKKGLNTWRKVKAWSSLWCYSYEILYCSARFYFFIILLIILGIYTSSRSPCWLIQIEVTYNKNTWVSQIHSAFRMNASTQFQEKTSDLGYSWVIIGRIAGYRLLCQGTLRSPEAQAHVLL